MAKSTSALPILAGGAAVLFLAGGKKKKKKASGNVRWGIRISSDCSKVDVVDQKLFNQFMFGAFNELVEIDPSLSLIQMSDALFGDVAPNCSGFPEDPESAEVAELYAVIARNVVQFMLADPRLQISMGELVDEATKISFTDWYRAWRNYPSADAPEAPSDQVSFSSDLSTFKIGSKWYTQTLLPFVKQAAEAGSLDSVFENFVASMGVLVGRFVMPISDLPQDEESVVRFLDEIQKAIQQASKGLAGA